MDVFVGALIGSVIVFSLLTMIALPFVGRFKGMTPIDTLSRAVAGGICLTAVLATLIFIWVAGYNLVKVPSPSFPFVVVLLLCLMALAIWAGPAVAFAWLSAKWLLRPVRRREG